MVKIVRITTVPISLKLLLTGQMKYMRERGLEVTMVSADGPEVIEVTKREDVPHIVIPFTRRITLIQDLKCFFSLVRLFRNIRPDIVHTHTPKAGLLGMTAAKIAGVSIRLHTIAGLPLMTAGGLKRKVLELTEVITYKAASRVLPNSKSIKAFILQHEYINAEKIDMIGEGSTNGIELSRFNPEAIDSDKLDLLMKEINYNPTKTYVLAVGRIVKDKGIIELIDAFNQLSKCYPTLHLLLVGPIENIRKVESLPERIYEMIKSSDRITHINWSDDVEYYMSFADVLVHASHREGFPNVLLQAGAMKCPIVCSKVPGNIDIVKQEESGLIFENGNTMDLVAKLDQVLSDKDKNKLYTEHLYKEIHSFYNRSYMHKEIHRYYMDMLNQKET